MSRKRTGRPVGRPQGLHYIPLSLTVRPDVYTALENLAKKKKVSRSRMGGVVLESALKNAGFLPLPLMPGFQVGSAQRAREAREREAAQQDTEEGDEHAENNAETP